MRIAIGCFFLLLFAAGCSEVETIENRDEQGVLLEKYERKKEDFSKHGKYFAYYLDGKIKEESFYQNNELTGERKAYYENGNLDYVEHYENGAFVGIYQKYNEQGQLIQEGQYLDNEMSGVWKRWYENGAFREETWFAHNQENGPFKEFHQNGKIKTEGTFTNGDNEQGVLKKYDETGDLIETMYCIYGICNTSWRKGEGDIPVDTARIQRLAEIKKRSEEEN